VSDFLSNLAARSSASAEAIQPRLPSLFEPLRPSVGTLATPNFMEWDQNRETSEEPIRHSDSPKIQRPSPAPRTEGETQPDPVRPQTRPAFQASPSQTPVGDSLVAALPNQSDRNVRERLRHAATGDSPTRPGETQPDPVRPQIHPASQASGSQPAPSQTPVRQSLVAALPNQPDGNVGERLRQAATASSPTRAARKVLSAPPVRSDPAWLSGARSNPTEPAIQVTIGRIEVRAAAQQPPASKERSASPVMRLDEYLRQKRGGA
jgi:hypothetical protein